MNLMVKCVHILYLVIFSFFWLQTDEYVRTNHQKPERKSTKFWAYLILALSAPYNQSYDFSWPRIITGWGQISYHPVHWPYYRAGFYIITNSFGVSTDELKLNENVLLINTRKSFWQTWFMYSTWIIPKYSLFVTEKQFLYCQQLICVKDLQFPFEIVLFSGPTFWRSKALVLVWLID